MLTSGAGSREGGRRDRRPPKKPKKCSKKSSKIKARNQKKGLLFFSKEKVITEYCKYI